MADYLLWLLLPVAAASGWYLARRGSEKSSGARVSELSSSYFRGLNYLLNEQPDKAIEVFLEIAELDSGAVETQLALGNLFRRRGEVDRAIRLHQNLIARPTLSAEQKTTALLELGEDYMRAGLLDRAENLLSDLVAINAHAPQALRHLIAIYQQERDWPKAIEHARRLQKATGANMGDMIAQFHCELSEAARAAGDMAAARRQLDHALVHDSECVRARIIEGHLCLDSQDPAGAISAFSQVPDLDPDYVPEILGPVLDCHQQLGDMQGARRWLEGLVRSHQGISAVLALYRVIEEQEGRQPAAAFLTEQLKARPSVRGLAALIETSLDSAAPEARDSLGILRDLSTKLLAGKPMYRCHRCGFGARAHHWQCPSCKTWNSVKPIQGVAAE
ncbi:MAG TPA: lipopolysaccharide assembly protein LapB [Xanthomonadaceae bacterium]|nr:lipopolysaccharide assembly protein LapB [Xanthomonadaceae bacterium]